MNKDLSDSLTFLLPLFGRPAFTKRWLKFARETHITSQIYIADGKINDSPFSHPDFHYQFPELNIVYKRYNDLDMRCFFNKMYDSLQMITTDYVLMADNDDFPIIQGILECVNFLEANPSFSAAGGQVAGLFLPSLNNINSIFSSKVPLAFVTPTYIDNCWYDCHDISDNSPATRVKSQLDDPLALHYYVHRTDNLRLCFEYLSRLEDPMLVSESVVNTLVAGLGKVSSCHQRLILIRQIGTSLGSGKIGDITTALARQSLSRSIRSSAQCVSSSLALIYPAVSFNWFQGEFIRVHYETLLSRSQSVLSERLPFYSALRSFILPLNSKILLLIRSSSYWLQLLILSIFSPNPITRTAAFYRLQLIRKLRNFLFIV